MDKDIKSIGYGVKINDEYISSFRSIPVFSDYEWTASCGKLQLINDRHFAEELAKEANGKVVELYAREVEDSEDD